MFRSALTRRARLCLVPLTRGRAYHGSLFDPTIGLSDHHKEIYTMFRQFSDESFAPFMQDWDKREEFPLDTLKKAASLGLGGIYVKDEAKGGSMMSRLDASIIFEALAAGCTSTAAFLSIHNMCAWMLDSFGSEALKEQYLQKLTQIDLVASYCLTEPGSGSDSSALTTTAKLDQSSGHYVLNGTKAFISGGGQSDIYFIMARTGAEPGPKGITCFLVDSALSTISFGKKEEKLGWNSQPTRAVILEDCRVPVGNVLGTIGDGFKIAMKGLDGGRINIASCSLGAAQASFELALEHVKGRSQFKTPLLSNQGVQFKLASMLQELTASRNMVRQAAMLLDAGDPLATAYCAMAKGAATEKCFFLIDEALQLHGGYGYLKDYKVQQYWRDSRVHRILEGTNEIMKIIVARSLEKS